MKEQILLHKGYLKGTVRTFVIYAHFMTVAASTREHVYDLGRVFSYDGQDWQGMQSYKMLQSSVLLMHYDGTSLCYTYFYRNILNILNRYHCVF